MSEELYLERIAANGERSYLVTLSGPDASVREYDFTVSAGEMPMVSAPAEFDTDVGSFGYSHLVFKAVSDFHQARQHPLGRPDWSKPS